jgi:hypothetical protein
LRVNELNELIIDAETIRGRWHLEDGREITYRVRREDDGTETIRVSGILVAAEAGGLLISLTQERTRGALSAGLIKLTGHWRADENNRILFDVAGHYGRSGSLILTGEWEIGPSHEIVYSYARAKAGAEEIQKLVFKGIWDIDDGRCITYRLEGSTDCVLKFRGTFQTRSILAKEGALRYQIGIEIEGRPEIRTLALFGKWKLSRTLEIFFEMEYAGGRKQTIVFGGVYSPSPDFGISVMLKTRSGESLGVEVVLTEEVFDGRGEMFLRLRHSAGETALETGMKFLW